MVSTFKLSLYAQQLIDKKIINKEAFISTNKPQPLSNTIRKKINTNNDKTKSPLIESKKIPRRFSGNDCNDNRRDRHSNATEIYDNIDNDCDGTIDEGQTLPLF
jgi:hypothetical protein